VSDFPLSFTADSLIAEAREVTGGLEDFGSGPFVEPLRIFVDSLRDDAMLNATGVHIAKSVAMTHIVNRLNYVNDRKLYSQIAEQKIVKPVFIIGFPRTGTTILHDILAQDPANRAPLTWEVMFPSPPPQTKSFKTDPRIAACEASFAGVRAAIPQFKAMHPMGAELSQECVTLMGEAMCTPLFHNQFRVNGYQDWVDLKADWSHVYDFHHKQLQHMQSGHMLDRWVLKTGAHMWGLEHLLATYPDARIVFTQRHPIKSLTSYASLTALVRTLGSDHVDKFEVAADWSVRLKRALEHVWAVRMAKAYPNAIFLDVLFSDFIRDQFGVVEKIYDTFGLPMSEQGAAAMRKFIAENPPGVHGVHLYDPKEYGVREDEVGDTFRAYIERFDLRPDA
jgi:hypothetical protein